MMIMALNGVALDGWKKLLISGFFLKDFWKKYIHILFFIFEYLPKI